MTNQTPTSKTPDEAKIVTKTVASSSAIAAQNLDADKPVDELDADLSDIDVDALLEADSLNDEDEDSDDENADEDDLDEELEGLEDDEFAVEDEILPPRAPDDLDAEEKVRLMATAADAVRAEDISVLDLRGLTIIADFFLICTGKSSIQLRAIADRIEERMRDSGVRKPRMEGYQEATWILLDYGDVVVHLMAAEQRAFYRLEEFWDAAPRLELNLLPEDAGGFRANPSGFETLTPPEAEFAGSDKDN